MRTNDTTKDSEETATAFKLARKKFWYTNPQIKNVVVGYQEEKHGEIKGDEL